MFFMYMRRSKQFVAQWMVNWSKWWVDWHFLLNEKPNVLPRTIKLVLLHGRSESVVLHKQKVYPHDIFFKTVQDFDEHESGKNAEALGRHGGSSNP